jgi:hypothetical protein
MLRFDAIFLNEKICIAIAMGTNTPGNTIYGKREIMILDGSFVKYLTGVGKDNTATIRIFRSKAMPVRLYANTNLGESFLYFHK